MATLEELEARVAALEASQADYRAVIAAINALRENQRELTTTVRDQGRRLDTLETSLADFRQEARANFRSVDEHLGELRDLVISLGNGRA
jgi:septal ring factor EnvC (AmiA/AmiB activator)